MNLPHDAGDIPYVTTDQMREVDRLMIEEYEIELLQMMENAGRNLAHLARSRFFDGDPVSKRVAVLAGTGGNGGGALVAARRLHGYGAEVRVFVTADDDEFAPVPSHQITSLRRIGLPVEVGAPDDGRAVFDLLIDGVIGYSLLGAPRGVAAQLIEWANRLEGPVLALDVPSGLDAGSGTVYDPVIRAAVTMTLALPKAGMRGDAARDVVGELYLADIGVPPELYERPSLGLQVGHIFARSDILRLW